MWGADAGTRRWRWRRWRDRRAASRGWTCPRRCWRWRGGGRRESQICPFAEGDASRAEAAGAVRPAPDSRFGVMFFDQPEAAFRHLRGAMKPRRAAVVRVLAGRRETIRWAAVPAKAARQASGLDLPTADPHAPGPFRLCADTERGEGHSGGRGLDRGWRFAPFEGVDGAWIDCAPRAARRWHREWGRLHAWPEKAGA